MPDTLGYIPRDAFAVALVPTDFDGDQWQRFETLVAPALKGSDFGTVRENIAASIPDVNFDEQIAPLLGETLVLAQFGRRENPDMHELPGGGAAIGLVGDGFVFDDSDGRQPVKLAPLGEPSADVQTSGDVVEAEVKTPLR